VEGATRFRITERFGDRWLAREAGERYGRERLRVSVI
jgi:hypothetical protein